MVGSSIKANSILSASHRVKRVSSLAFKNLAMSITCCFDASLSPRSILLSRAVSMSSFAAICRRRKFWLSLRALTFGPKWLTFYGLSLTCLILSNVENKSKIFINVNKFLLSIIKISLNIYLVQIE